MRKVLPLENNFAPVISSCPIHIATIQSKDINECNIIKKTDDIGTFILMKIRFIDMEDFDNYILKNSNANLIILTLIKGFNHILQSIQLLIDANIVQFDIKGPNIVFDNKKTLPIIIDFGLSLPMDKLTSETLYNYFYIYAPEYYVWPLEVHYLNLLLHITSEPEDRDLRDLAKRFTKSNVALGAFSSKFRTQYSHLCYEILKHYNAMPYKDRIKKVLRGWKTWDNYSLAILYLKFLFFLTKSQKNKSIDNNFVRFMTQLLITNLHPNFERRLSVKDTIKAFDEFIGNAQKTDLVAIEEIITLVTKNKKQINKSIVLNARRIHSLTEKSIQR